MVSEELNQIIKQSFSLFFKEHKLFIAIGIFSVIPLLLLHMLVYINLAETIIMLLVAGLANIFAYMIYILATKHYLSTNKKNKEHKKSIKNKHKLEKTSGYHVKNSFLPLLGTIVLIQIILGLSLLVVGSIIGGMYLLTLILFPLLTGSLIIQVLFATLALILGISALVFVGIHLFFAPIIAVLEDIGIINSIKKSIKLVKEKFSERFVTILAIKILGITLSLGILIVFTPFEMILINSIKEGFNMISIIAQQLAMIPIMIMGVIYYLNSTKKKTKKNKPKTITKKKTINNKQKIITKKKSNKKTSKTNKKLLQKEIT